MKYYILPSVWLILPVKFRFKNITNVLLNLTSVDDDRQKGGSWIYHDLLSQNHELKKGLQLRYEEHICYHLGNDISYWSTNWNGVRLVNYHRIYEGMISTVTSPFGLKAFFCSVYLQIMTRGKSMGLSYQLDDAYSIYKGCLYVATKKCTVHIIVIISFVQSILIVNFQKHKSRYEVDFLLYPS